MTRKICSVILMLAMLAAGWIPSAAEGQEPIPIQFRKAGGGQFLYCNNPEFVKAGDLSTDENPQETYLMKNEGLKPGSYSVFFCFYNWTDFDVEPDIEFFSKNGARITVQSAGYYLPYGYEYWDCIGTWSDLMNIKIRTLNEYAQYVPYQGETVLPKTIQLQGDRDWVSRCIYNYTPIRPRSTFNMLVNFTIDSGEADVNFTALKNYGQVGDRSHHNPNAAPGKYFNDTSIKGIETETLPMVEADLNVTIDENTVNGEALPVKIFNQYYNDGNVMPHWMTNINPNRDGYLYSKYVAAGSDMLEFTYQDDSKLAYYGANVPEEQRDNIWRFDIYHKNTQAYQAGFPGKAEDHVPNAFTSKTLDINNLPDNEWEFNLGNFGVTNRYYVNIENRDTKPRVLNYLLETSLSSNIIIVRDEDGTMLNPYTLKPEDPFALCKGINSQKIEECMFSATVPAGGRKTYILDVILPTNCYGGMVNALKVDDHAYLTEKKALDFPVYQELYQNADVFYNGAEFMKWDAGQLYRETESGEWQPVFLPESAEKIFGSRTREFRIVRLPDGYAARFSGWDDLGLNVAHKEVENRVYFFDENFHHVGTKTFPDYIYDMCYTNGALYLTSDKTYCSGNLIDYKPVDTFPVTAGDTAVFRKPDGFYRVRPGEPECKIKFEGGTPHELFTNGDIFYYRKSWKAYYTDLTTQNILSVSSDGVNWTDYTISPNFYELARVSSVGGEIQADCKYGLFRFPKPEETEWVLVKLDGEYLSFEVPAKTVSDRTMVPLRFFFERLGAKVNWDDDTQTAMVELNKKNISFQIGNPSAEVNGQEATMDVPAMLENDKTLIPLRFLSENLGYQVEWEETAKTAVVSSVKQVDSIEKP